MAAVPQSRKAIFAHYDRHSNGAIDYGSFKQLCSDQGNPLIGDAFDAVCAELDPSNSGLIPYKAFHLWWAKNDRWEVAEKAGLRRAQTLNVMNNIAKPAPAPAAPSVQRSYSVVGPQVNMPVKSAMLSPAGRVNRSATMMHSGPPDQLLKAITTGQPSLRHVEAVASAAPTTTQGALMNELKQGAVALRKAEPVEKAPDVHTVLMTAISAGAVLRPTSILPRPVFTEILGEEEVAAKSDSSSKWYEAVEEDTGTVYYINSVTDESAWQLPAGASLENPDDLPYPWAQAKDGNGNTYYFHEESGQTTWVLPQVVQNVLNKRAESRAANPTAEPSDVTKPVQQSADGTTSYTMRLPLHVLNKELQTAIEVKHAQDSVDAMTQAQHELALNESSHRSASIAAISELISNTETTSANTVAQVRVTEVNVLCGSTEDEGYPLLSLPQSLYQPDANTLLIADRSNGRIRKFDLLTKQLSTFAGSGEVCKDLNTDVKFFDKFGKSVAGKAARLQHPASLCVDPINPGCFYVADDANPQRVIRHVDAQGNIKIVAGQDYFVEPLEEEEDDMRDWLDLCQSEHAAGCDACFTDIESTLPAQLNGQFEPEIFITSLVSNCVRAFHPRTSDVRLVLGNGTVPGDEQMEAPFGLAVDSKGRLLISSMGGQKVLRYDPGCADVSMRIECVAGRKQVDDEYQYKDGPGSEALLGEIAGLCTDSHDTIYMCDHSFHTIRAITPDGVVYSLLGMQADALKFELCNPFCVHFDKFAADAGKPRLFVLDSHRLIEVKLDRSALPSMSQTIVNPKKAELVDPIKPAVAQPQVNARALLVESINRRGSLHLESTKTSTVADKPSSANVDQVMSQLVSGDLKLTRTMKIAPPVSEPPQVVKPVQSPSPALKPAEVKPAMVVPSTPPSSKPLVLSPALSSKTNSSTPQSTSSIAPVSSRHVPSMSLASPTPQTARGSMMSPIPIQTARGSVPDAISPAAFNQQSLNLLAKAASTPSAKERLQHLRQGPRLSTDPRDSPAAAVALSKANDSWKGMGFSPNAPSWKKSSQS